jgi:molecular chaperone GrpE
MPSDQPCRSPDETPEDQSGSTKPTPEPTRDEENEVQILEVVSVDETTGTMEGTTSAIEPVEDPLEGGETADRSDAEKLKAAIEEAERYKGLLHYRQADFENFRKRSEREAEGLREQASADLVGRLLPVLDNMERATQAGGASVDSLRQGVRLTHRMLLDILIKEGLAPIDAVGVAFDPSRHEAGEMADVDGTSKGIVLEVLLTGYTFRNKLLRPALVKVASGKPGTGGSGTGPVG